MHNIYVLFFGMQKRYTNTNPSSLVKSVKVLFLIVFPFKTRSIDELAGNENNLLSVPLHGRKLRDTEEPVK